MAGIGAQEPFLAAPADRQSAIKRTFRPATAPLGQVVRRLPLRWVLRRHRSARRPDRPAVLDPREAGTRPRRAVALPASLVPSTRPCWGSVRQLTGAGRRVPPFLLSWRRMPRWRLLG